MLGKLKCLLGKHGKEERIAHIYKYGSMCIEHYCERCGKLLWIGPLYSPFLSKEETVDILAEICDDIIVEED